MTTTVERYTQEDYEKASALAERTTQERVQAEVLLHSIQEEYQKADVLAALGDARMEQRRAALAASVKGLTEKLATLSLRQGALETRLAAVRRDLLARSVEEMRSVEAPRLVAQRAALIERWLAWARESVELKRETGEHVEAHRLLIARLEDARKRLGLPASAIEVQLLPLELKGVYIDPRQVVSVQRVFDVFSGDRRNRAALANILKDLR